MLRGYFDGMIWIHFPHYSIEWLQSSTNEQIVTYTTFPVFKISILRGSVTPFPSTGHGGSLNGLMRMMYIICYDSHNHQISTQLDTFWRRLSDIARQCSPPPLNRGNIIQRNSLHHANAFPEILARITEAPTPYIGYIRHLILVFLSSVSVVHKCLLPMSCFARQI